MRTEAIKDTNGKIWLSGWGNTEADIMIIGSHPTREDLHEEEVFANIDDEYCARDEIDNALKIAGIHHDDCWFTSMVKYGIGNKDKPTAEQIEECAALLDEEINEVKPKLIITLGAEVFKRVMKQNIKQSDYVGEIIDCPYGKVLVNYSPANVYRVDPKLRPEFISNFDLAQKFVKGRLKYQSYESIVVRDPKVNLEILKHYMDNSNWEIGYDAEWKGKFMKGETMYTFQYSCEPNKAIVLPIVGADQKTENLELLNTMKVFLEHPKAKRMGWNIRADDKRLTERGFKLPDETLTFDGMKAMAFFDSRYNKGLEVGIKKFTNYKPYYNALNKALREHKIAKEDMSELMFKEEKIFFDYCAGDAVSHREACMNMMKEFPHYVPDKKVRDYYFNTYLPLSHYLMDMEMTGIPIDIDCMTKLTNQYNDCYDRLNKRLMELTKSYGFNSKKYDEAVEKHGEIEAKAKGFRPDFNPRSYLDKRKLFFDVLKLTPAYYVKKGKAKPSAWYNKQKDHIKKLWNPSCNGKSMASIRFELADKLKKDPTNKELAAVYEVVKTYLDLARISVFANKFLSTQGVDFKFDDGLTKWDDEAEPLEAVDDEDNDSPLKSSYWGALSNDNRIHPDFYECLDNFRSSSKPNVQNPASKVLSHIPKIFEEFKLDPPANIRNVFYSGHKDWHFAEIDVAGADLFLAAVLSRDKDYIYDMRKGGFHTTKMREYFKDKTLTKEDYSKYVTAKSITFRVAYTSGLMSAALPIQAEIFAESGNLVDIEVINYALRTWERYETYMEYRKKCTDQVDKEQCIMNERGMRFDFEHTKDFSIKSGWHNQALAYPIASELALFMYDVNIQLKKQFKKDKLWLSKIYPCNTVHDAAIFLIHKDLLIDNYFPNVCLNYFSKEVKCVTGDTLGCELTVGKCWKDKAPIYTNETEWSFKDNCWNWKK
jgi:uracil-DNA glycosylase family 4